MLRHQTESGTAESAAYAPVPRRDLMTDAHIEDYLDHRVAPLVGSVSYEERQQMRADLRQEIDSTVAAHMELGSSREQAIALALRSMEPPVATGAVAGVGAATVTRSQPRGSGKSLPLSIACFSASALASLVLTFLSRHISGAEVPVILAVILGVFPFAAGSVLGAKNARAPFQGLVLAHLLLYLPVTVIFALLVSSEGHPGSLWPLAGFTAIYQAASAVFGSFGLLAGGWLRESVEALRRRG